MPFQKKKKVSCHSNSALEPPHRPNLAELYLLLNCTSYHLTKRKKTGNEIYFVPTMREVLHISSLIIVRIQQRGYYYLQFYRRRI